MTSLPSPAAILTDPIVQTGVLAALGALVTQGILRNHPQWRLAGQVALFIALTTLLLYHGVVPYEPGPPQDAWLKSFFFGLAKVIWWVNVALSLVAFVRVFLTFENLPREVRLMQDIVVALIYISVALSVITNVFGFPIGSIVATSGVVAIILGFALQSTLSDLFSGIALNLGQAYNIGDWIVVNDTIEGHVIETKWRSTHLLSGTNDLVILPNNNLAKANLLNRSGSDRSHGASLTVRFVPTTRPAVIVEVMHEVLLSCTSILTVPVPTVLVKSLDSESVEVELSFGVKDRAGIGAAKNEIFDLIFRHAKATGLHLSSQDSKTGRADFGAEQGLLAASHHSQAQIRLLNALPLFSSLTAREKETLAQVMSERDYHKGDVLVEQGAVLHSLMIVRRGVLRVIRVEDGRRIELGRLAPGDCFGEEGLLTGAGSAGAIEALCHVEICEIAQAALMPVLQERPVIAEELANILARRVQNEQYLFSHMQSNVVIPSSSGFVARIRQIFQLV